VIYKKRRTNLRRQFGRKNKIRCYVIFNPFGFILKRPHMAAQLFNWLL